MVAVWQPDSTFRAWEAEPTLEKHCIIDEIIKEYVRGQFLHGYNLRWTMNEGVIVEIQGGFFNWSALKMTKCQTLRKF